MISIEFNRDFQIRLVINMLCDDKFFAQAIGQIHLNDFGLPACRLLLETARRYYFEYKKLPSFDILQLEVLRALDDRTGMIETRLTPADMESLATIMGWLARSTPATLDTKYFSSRLFEFLQYTRFTQISVEGHSAASYIKAVTEMSDQLNRGGGTGFEFINAAAPVNEDTSSARNRLGFGVWDLDRMVSHGLTRQEMGLLVAFTGVGKTTALINILANAVLRGMHCLFITLELKPNKIIERFQAILAMINVDWFKKSRDKWPAELQRRWRFVTAPDCPLPGSMDVIEKIGATVFDIDKTIYAWKQHKEAQGIDPEKCAVVAVDWLGRVDATGAKSVTRDSNDERRNFHVLEHFDEFKKRHNIWLWTAAQAGGKAEGKERLKCSDISWGVSQHHLIDWSVGLAPRQDATGVASDTGASFSDDSSLMEQRANGTDLPPPCDRTLVATHMKVRDGAVTGKTADLYQGPTLKLWSKRSNFEEAELSARRSDATDLRTLLAIKQENV